MKHILTYLFIILILGSCSTHNSQREIKEFEQMLGKENVEELNRYISEFEDSLLRRKYPDYKLSDAYRKIAFESIEESDESFKKYFSDSGKQRFLNSQLWNEIYAPADSVWIEDNEFVIRFVYNSNDGIKPTSQTGERLPELSSRDSLKTELLKWIDFNREGKYIRALLKIRNRNKFLNSITEIKSILGVITPGVIQHDIKSYQPDLNDYINRRVIAIELSRTLNNYRLD